MLLTDAAGCASWLQDSGPSYTPMAISMSNYTHFTRDFLTVMEDLNAKVGSDNTLLGHVMGLHSLGVRNSNCVLFANF